MSITDPQEPYFKDGLWTWNGTRWRKQPFLLGYSEMYYETETDTGDGGVLTQDFTAVPSGELWIVTSYTCHASSGAHANMVYLGVMVSGATRIVNIAPSLAQYTSLKFHGRLVLSAGAYLRTRWDTATNGDVFMSYALGYKMSLQE